MKQYNQAKCGMEVTEFLITEGQFLLQLQTKVHSYDLVPKSEIADMEEFFPEMEESAVTKYKFTETMHYLAPPSPAWQSMYA